MSRPRVPVAVQIAVAERQLRERGTVPMFASLPGTQPSAVHRLRSMLVALFGKEPCHLDHDPPLMLRWRTAAGYSPDANDPEFLVWRTAEEHRIKTYVRGDGAQLSDMGKRRKEIRRRKKAERPRRKWPKRKLRRAR